MKNVLFMLAFMLMGTFAFAGNGQFSTEKNILNSINEINEINEINQLSPIYGVNVKLEHFVEHKNKSADVSDNTINLKYDCVRTTLSCGLTGWSCGETTLEIIENALAADEAFC